MQDDSHLPAHLTIHLVREIADDGHEGFVACSPQFPDLGATSFASEDAISDLLWTILNEQDVPEEVVDALAKAGYSDEVAVAWRDIAQGAYNRRYRYDPHAAVETLKEYTREGMPALIACRYIEIGIDAALAVEAYAAGGTPDDAISYIHHSETHKWWKWDYDIDPWIRSALPAGRGRLYAMDCSVEAAVEWEAVVVEYGIADEHISVLLRAGFTSETARAHMEVDGQDRESLVAEAQRAVAERARQENRMWRAPVAAAVGAQASDPWAAPVPEEGSPSAWGDGEPPF